MLRKRLKEAYGDMVVFGSDSVTGFNYTGGTCTDSNGRKTAGSRPLCISTGTGINGSSEACLPPDRKEDVLEEDAGGVDAENSRNPNASNIPEVAACFEFRLFNSSSASKVPGASTRAPPPRVFLDSDTDSAGEDDGGFLDPRRPAAYYFAAAATGSKKREFQDAAVTGEAVRRWQRVRYTGWEVPWRVKTIAVPPAVADDRRGWVKALEGAAATAAERGDGADGRKTRKKPGKKRRIVLRTRRRAAEEAREKKRKEEVEKEVRMREKRTRMNREKKIKRKQKEKAKKGETAAAVSATQAPDNSGDSVKGEKGIIKRGKAKI